MKPDQTAPKGLIAKTHIDYDANVVFAFYDHCFDDQNTVFGTLRHSFDINHFSSDHRLAGVYICIK